MRAQERGNEAVWPERKRERQSLAHPQSCLDSGLLSIQFMILSMFVSTVKFKSLYVVSMSLCSLQQQRNSKENVS